jgi:hypothetical protein
MAFAMGKLVQAQKDLFDRLQAHLSGLSTVSSDLGPFLQQTQQALKSRTESPALDPIVLSDLIVPFDACQAVEDLQMETDKIARNSLVMQVRLLFPT